MSWDKLDVSARSMFIVCSGGVHHTFVSNLLDAVLCACVYVKYLPRWRRHWCGFIVICTLKNFWTSVSVNMMAKLSLDTQMHYFVTSHGLVMQWSVSVENFQLKTVNLDFFFFFLVGRVLRIIGLTDNRFLFAAGFDNLLVHETINFVNPFTANGRKLTSWKAEQIPHQIIPSVRRETKYLMSCGICRGSWGFLPLAFGWFSTVCQR